MHNVLERLYPIWDRDSPHQAEEAVSKNGFEYQCKAPFSSDDIFS
jgi:hypothetical protein